MTQFIDETGKRFGRLVVIRQGADSNQGRTRWVCRCDCGNEITVISSSLRRKRPTRSCGCLRSDIATALGPTRVRHGMWRSLLYKVWVGMLQRCENPNDAGYHNYGGRGVEVCADWHDNVNFFEWAAATGYREGLSLDRYPDKNGNYDPSNCRWATWTQQARNKRNNRLFEWKGERRTAMEWQEITGIKQSTIFGRDRRGWSVDEIFTIPLHALTRHDRVWQDGRFTPWYRKEETSRSVAV